MRAEPPNGSPEPPHAHPDQAQTPPSPQRPHQRTDGQFGALSTQRIGGSGLSGSARPWLGRTPACSPTASSASPWSCAWSPRQSRDASQPEERSNRADVGPGVDRPSYQRSPGRAERGRGSQYCCACGKRQRASGNNRWPNPNARRSSSSGGRLSVRSVDDHTGTLEDHILGKTFAEARNECQGGIEKGVGRLVWRRLDI